MTINEFITKENLTKKNPFENCAVIEKFGMNEYMNVAVAAEKILFNEETNLYRALFREFAVRLSVMSTMLNLEMSDEYELGDVFEVVMCSGIWDKFITNVAKKVVPDISSVIAGVNTYLDDEVEKNRLGTRKFAEEVLNTLVTLLDSDAFQKLLETIDVEEVEGQAEDKEG